MIVRRRFICRSASLWLAVCSVASALDYQIEANIRYDQYPETVLDILQPSAPALANRPGIIVIHGGGWCRATRSACSKNIASVHPARLRGGERRVRLAKSAPAPAAVSDVLQATQWFHAHAARYKVDPNRILVTAPLPERISRLWL